jgi:hypothetical protein
MRRKSKAQSFLEYATLVAVVVGAFVAMKVLMVRGFQGKLLQNADIFGKGEQYERGLTTYINLDAPPTNIGEEPPGEVDPCIFLNTRVNQLEGEKAMYIEQAEAKEARAVEMDQTALTLELQGMLEQAQRMRDSAQALRDSAESDRTVADAKQQQIDIYRDKYPQCFDES